MDGINNNYCMHLIFFMLLLGVSQIIRAQESITTRSFYLGFTYQPYDWSDLAFEETYSFIDKNSDMIFHYFDDGVPWGEVFSGSKYHGNVESLIKKRIDNVAKKQKVTVGVNFLGKDRRSLASYWGEEEGLPRPGKWSRLGIGHPDIVNSYIAYCRTMIERFKPDYFIYGMEVDSVELAIDSKEFRAIEHMVSKTYTSLRKEYPELPLVLTFMLGPEEDMHKRRAMVKQLLPYTDLYAVSVYPYLFDGVGGNAAKLPDNFFSRIRNYIGEKPFAIAETGFNAKSWRVMSRFIWIHGKEKSQANYVRFLLSESNKLDAVFVNWWVPRDLDRLWNKMEEAGADPILSQWNSNGLVDANGFARKGLMIWQQWLKKPLKKRCNHVIQPTAVAGDG